MLLQLGHHRLPDLLGLAHLEVEGVEVGREDGDVALAQVVDEFLRLPQRREAEERRGRTADGPAHGADALLDLVLGIVFVGLGLAVDQALALGLRQILVTPGVRTDGVAGGGNLLEDAGLVGGMQADREEDRLGAVRGQRGEHVRRVLRPGAVVEGQHDLAFAQKIVALEVLEAEAGPAGGIDLDRAGDAQGVGIAAGGWGRRRGRGLRDHHRLLLGRTGSRPTGVGARARRRSLKLVLPQALPGPARAPGRTRRFAARKSRQTQLRIREWQAQTLLLPDACPTSDHGMRQALGHQEPDFPPISLIPP